LHTWQLAWVNSITADNDAANRWKSDTWSILHYGDERCECEARSAFVADSPHFSGQQVVSLKLANAIAGTTA
jgi:hypothetical protein